MPAKAKIILNQKGMKSTDKNRIVEAMTRSIIVLYYTLKIKIQILKNLIPYETKNKKSDDNKNWVKYKLTIKIV